VRLGASVGFFSLSETPSDTLRFVREAEALGYATAWVPEPYGNDAVSVLSWLAGATTKIGLGSAILAMPGRTPAMTAQSAATIDLISGGRLVLGLGSSGPQVSEGWHGVPFAGQLQRTREYVEIVRKALRRERLEYQGRQFTLPLAGGEGKPLKLLMTPLRSEVPIFLATLGPKNTALCGEIADGWMPTWFAPEHASALGAPLAEGAARAGRDGTTIQIVPTVHVHIADDIDAARDAVRPVLALYVGGMGSRQHNFYNQLIARYGFEDVARTVQDLYLDHRIDEAAATLPEALIDMVSLCGPVEHVAVRLAAYEEAGVDEIAAAPLAESAAGRVRQLRALAEAAGRSGISVS
jgi:F420-dependent oxidoreductase-like protein